MKTIKMKKQRGFTLIELLVSMAIISVLAAIGLASYHTTQKRSRDARRKADVETIRSSLEIYRADQGLYPLTDSIATDLLDYLNPFPQDPSTQLSYESNYTSDDGSTYGLCVTLESDGSGYYATPVGVSSGDACGSAAPTSTPPPAAPTSTPPPAAATATPTPPPPPTATPPPFSGSLSFAPTDDAKVREGSSTNYGSDSTLELDQSTDYEFYIKFTVSGIPADTSVDQARLRLRCTNGSDVGGIFSTSVTSWSEDTINWFNKPSHDTGVGSWGSVSSGNWYELDVSSVVTGNGTFSFAARTTSTNGADYSSKEGSYIPELVVDYSSI